MLPVQAMAEEPGIRTQELRQEPTGLPLQTLQWVGRSICGAPDAFDLHPEVEALLKARRCFTQPLYLVLWMPQGGAECRQC